MMRKSECITAVMVLPAAAIAGDASAESASTDSAIPDAMPGSFQREMWNILYSPDVKPIKDRSFVMHAARYLGAVTRCNSKIFETCTKRAARQSGFASWPRGESSRGIGACFTLQTDRRTFS